MIVLLMGATGSGKTTVAKELEKKGLYIIPTHTTRPPREHDDFTYHVSNVKFDELLRAGSYMAYSSFRSNMGLVSYGIPTLEHEIEHANGLSPVIIAVREYIPSIEKYSKSIGHKLFKIYLDVDEDTIIEKSLGDNFRGQSNMDLLDRLERDRVKNNELKMSADLVIENYGMEISPENIAEIIYRNIINRRN